jgi:hypothetical protein
MATKKARTASASKKTGFAEASTSVTTLKPLSLARCVRRPAGVSSSRRLAAWTKRLEGECGTKSLYLCFRPLLK